MGGREEEVFVMIPAVAAAAVAAAVAGSPWTLGWLTCICPGDQQSSLNMAGRGFTSLHVAGQ